MFGGIEITVPDDVEVRNQGLGIFGGFAVRGSERPDPNAPVVTINGVAVFGGVGGQTTSRRRRTRGRR